MQEKGFSKTVNTDMIDYDLVGENGCLSHSSDSYIAKGGCLGMDMICTKDLTKFYGKTRGIEHLNLTVGEGEVFGFIGPNGAGKSTTIRTLLGLIRSTSGTASVLGRDILEEHEAILQEVGYMPSEALFYSGMRVWDVIRLSAGLRQKTAACLAEARILCGRLQLDTGRRIEELSLGNRKKVSIVCAFMHRPSLCILDEPTSGLDPLMQKEFFDLIEERSREGTTFFLSSHVLSEIRRYCSRAAIIRDGSIIACGTVEELSRTNAKRVTLHDASGLIQKLPGQNIRDVRADGPSVSFLYQGDLHLLMSLLADSPFTDLTIAEPELDEIFLHYYSEKGGDLQ